jgi:DNA polymerase III gamma/tau subunit
VGETLKTAESIGRKGKIMSVVAKDLITFAKDVLIAKTTGKKLLRGSEDAINQIMIRAERTTVNSLVSIIKIFSSIDADLRYSVSPLVTFEMTAVRATKLYDAAITSLEERISRIERNGVTVAPSAQENKVETEQKKNNDRPMDALGIWGRLTTYFRRNESMTYYSIAGDQNRVKIENKNLVVEANSQDYDTMLTQSFRDAVQRALDDDGVDLNFVVERKQTGIDMDKETVRMKKLAGSVKFNVIRK